MKLDRARLHTRRLQLGLTMRGLARDAGISQTLVKRLENTGEVDNITCATLQRLVDALSVDLIDILAERWMPPPGDDQILERLGTILLGRRSRITTMALASLLAIDAAMVEEQLLALSDKLQPVGIRVNRGSTGIRLVPVEQVPKSNDDPRHLQAPTSSDLRVLHRALSGELHRREVAAMKNGNVSLHRLVGSGLLEIRRSGTIILGIAARQALLQDVRKT